LEPRNRIFDAVGEISKSRVKLNAYERQLETAGGIWIEDVSGRLRDAATEADVNDIIIEISSVVESLSPAAGVKYANTFLGKALSLLVKAERQMKGSKRVMRRILGDRVADRAEQSGKRLLLINPGFMATKASIFTGIEKIHDTELHVSPDVDDSIETRVDSVVMWLDEIGVELNSFDGIACRSGFFKTIPSGTYRLVPEMIRDLEHPRIEHASNMSVAMVMKLAELSGRGENMLLTTSDPVVSDEIDTVERLTGYIKIKRDGSGAHYLNHKAVLKVLSSMLARNAVNISAVTAHLGYGISIVLHQQNKVTSLLDAFSGLPTTNKCGPLDLPRLIESRKSDDITFKELEKATFSAGGLLSLAGTDDFRTLESFRSQGATDQQKKKIALIFDFFSKQITSASLKLTSDSQTVDVIALTGGLANSDELVRRVESNIAGRYPLVLLPGSLEQEALAAGLIQGFHEPESVKNYVDERDRLKEKRREENRLLDTVIFDRKIAYKKKDAQILTLDELIDSTCVTVEEHFAPRIAIVGAGNEEAILAAKRANEEGKYRIAKFDLLGDFAEINQLAYDYDLIIDNDNYVIEDTDTPVDDALAMLESDHAQILMKGKMHTEDLLRGIFHYMKKAGRLQKGDLFSHVFVMDIPVRNKLLLISDAAVNTYPDESKRVKIIENCLKVARLLNIKKPKVAVISAIENVNQSVESSIDAERIAEHFEGREDCIVEGPLSFDVAMDQKIAQEKNYKGEITGTADVLVMPDIDAGNVLYKSLTTQSGATAAGVILCGDLPIVLTSRGDSARSKLASISLAVKLYLSMHGNKDQK